MIVLVFLVVLNVAIINGMTNTCAGHLYQNESPTSISPEEDKWYLNLGIPSSCSGEVKKYRVMYFYHEEDEKYEVNVAMWEPSRDQNTTFIKVDTNPKKISVDFDDVDGDGTKEKGISNVFVRKGSVVGVFFQGGKRLLPVLGSSSGVQSSVCKQSGDKSTATLNCTQTESNLLVLAEADIELIECDVPASISNGYVTYIDGDKEYGARIQYNCFIGYENTTANEILVCNRDAMWEGSTPTVCQIVSCSEITAYLNNGDVEGNSFSFGSNISFSCNEGYEIFGSDLITCRANKTWSNSIPECIIIKCNDPDSPQNGNKSQHTVTFGSSVTFACNEGYELIGDITITCQANMTWSGSTPTCLAKNCSYPGTPENGQIIGTMFTYQSLVAFNCRKGYYLSDTRAIVCQADQSWNSSIPQCNIINCGEPITDNFTEIYANDSYTYQSIVTFKCMTGYELHGNDITTCQANGEWNVSSPSCILVNCGDPGTPQNGIIVTEPTNTTYTSVIEYECDEGYILSETANITCQSNGEWTSSAPTCLPVDCGDPGTPMMGSQNNGAMYTFDSVVTFTCNEGYAIIGESSLMCDFDGHWNGPLPTCELSTGTLVMTTSVSSSPTNVITVDSSSSGPLLYGIVVGVVIVLITIVAVTAILILLLFKNRSNQAKNKYDVKNASYSSGDIVNPMIYSEVYGSSTAQEMQMQTMNRQELNNNDSLIYEDATTTRNDSTTTSFGPPIKNDALESNASYRLPSAYEVPHTLQRYQTDTSFNRGDESNGEHVNQLYMENEISQVYSDLDQAFENNPTNTTIPSILVTSVTEDDSGLNNQFYMENEIPQIYSELNEASESIPMESTTAVTNLLYSEIESELPSTISLQKTATAKRKTVIFEPPATETDELFEQLKKQNVNGITSESIHIGKTLGSGYFGNVCKGEMTTNPNTDDTIVVAIKTLNDRATEKDKIKFLQEAAIMAQFNHTNVLKLHGVVVTKTTCMIVIEFMSKGDLLEVLRMMRPDPGLLTNEEIPFTLMNFCRQICLGLSYLSQKGFVHRDIAARNILVDANNTCKIADFGLSRDLDDDDYYMANEGAKVPVKWTAPEALHYRKYSSASDVWSYGCLLYEIWGLGAKPFQNMTNMESIRKVDNGYRLPPPPGCPKEFYNLMIKCWHPDNNERPCFQDIMLIMLMQDKLILSIPEEDISTHPLAGTIGATLEAGEKMYEKLQIIYSTYY